MNQPTSGEPRWMVDGYEEWLSKESVPVTGGLAVDLKTVETAPWDRLGLDACVVHLDARGDFCNFIVCDVPPGGKSAPVRHLYEAVTYVLDGRGSTKASFSGGPEWTFEWGKGSLFALPVNASYQHFNASGRDRARLVNITSLPLLMKMFRNDEFIFNTPFDFRERLADQRLAQGEGNFIPVREHRHMWETSLVPDLLTFDQMRSSPGRGAGSTNIQFVLGDGTLHSHESEIPVGNYKKAHIHGDGYHIIQLSGSGYSLYWNEGEEPQRVEWEYGVAHSPSRGMWHQHFNVSDTPARYMAAGFGSIRYPVLSEKLEVLNRSYAQGGKFQIEYEDEDPAIRQLFDRERAAFRTRAEQA
jgi:hypothetical protein